MSLLRKLNLILSNSFLHSIHHECCLLTEENHGLAGDLCVHTNASNCCLALGKSPNFFESYFSQLLQKNYDKKNKILCDLLSSMLDTMFGFP